MSGTTSTTPFVETEALLAKMNEDQTREYRLLNEMTVIELSVFLNQLDALATDVFNVLRMKRPGI